MNVQPRVGRDSNYVLYMIQLNISLTMSLAHGDGDVTMLLEASHETISVSISHHVGCHTFKSRQALQMHCANARDSVSGLYLH